MCATNGMWVVACCAAVLVGCAGTAPGTKIHREEGRVWLEANQPWGLGERSSSLHAAQAAVTRAMGQEVRYEYLVGVSGLAFRMQLFQKSVCPSSPHPMCGWQCVARSTHALGRPLELYEAKLEHPREVAAARAAIVASIERGIPVQYGSEEDGLIVGYQNGGSEWLCVHPFVEGGRKRFVETKWPWGVAVWRPEAQPVRPRRVLAAEAIRQAVEMAGAKECQGYWVGMKAWEAYIQALEALDKGDEKSRADAMLGNAHIYNSLVDHRTAAAWYLREVAGEFDAKAAGHLRAAGDLYEKMAKEVLADATNRPVTVAPFPWMLKPPQTWTPAMRAEQVRRLKAAFELEKQAIDHLRQAAALLPA